MLDRTDDSPLLISQAQAGDPEAFARLMELHQARLHGQALAFVRHADDAQELVQETMIEAWKSLPRFDGSCRFFTWLYLILLRRRWRRNDRLARLMALATPAQQRRADQAVSDAPDPDVKDAEAALLRCMVESLPKSHRDVVRLRFYAAAAESEIAAALGLPLGTVKSRLHHALSKLRAMTDKVNQLHP
jgi:RNA polymerase sigma-70 factor (ECF subfamily)